ncbi:MAG: hypothetical protein COB42_07080 [Sulfurimonas sp.]|nr:MAG: hypothetical protein COB42_07080 [Sulfurimonas sp.]
MKKIILSAAVAAMAFSTSAVAADKGIDIEVSGQAVVYYETHDYDNADEGLFDERNSVAAGGIQLNLGADLGNNFTFGSQLTYLSTLGLEKTLVNNGKQQAGGVVDAATVSEIALTKIFIAKQIANTTLKIGRQELPQSLAPFSYSEGDSVFKNTFDAILAINTDIPKTTVVAAYVSKGTGVINLGLSTDLPAIGGAIYMLTAQTTAIPMTTLTATYYEAKNVTGTSGVAPTALVNPNGGASADIIWVDAAIAPKDAPIGLTFGLQGGVISVDTSTYEDTTAFGAKVGAKIEGFTLGLAFTSVDGDSKSQIAVRNLATGNRSPLYTQMVANQGAISLDSDTIVASVGYDAGSIGNFAVSYGWSDVDEDNGIVNTTTGDVDYSELDLVYKVKAGGVQYAAMLVYREVDKGGTITNTTSATTGSNAEDDTMLRFWARYNF